MALPSDPIAEGSQQAALECSEVLQTAIGRLEPELRAVFLLREIEELNYAEIADTLELSAGTVASRLNRARMQMKQLLTEIGWEP